MARPVTVAELVSRAKQHADMEGSSFISDAQWIVYASRHVTEFWDTLIQASPPGYFSSDYTFPFAVGQRSYLLPADFRALERVMVAQDNRQKPVLPLRSDERYAATTPTIGGSITIEYVPAPPVLTSMSDVVEGYSGWEDLISSAMARDALMKEESDSSLAQNIFDREVARMRSASSNRDRGAPKLIGKRDDDTATPWDMVAQERTLRYRLRGSFLELFSL